MKKLLTCIFVAICNFYFYTYCIGIFLMVSTVVIGGLNAIFLVSLISFVFVFNFIFLIFRHKVSFLTFGEEVIGNANKLDILNQTKTFSITRIPLLILIILTLAINGNVLDGLSEGKTYSIGVILSFSVLTASTYYGFKNFLLYAEMIPIYLLSITFFFVGFVYKNTPNGLGVFYAYCTLATIWIVIGFVYSSFKMVKKEEVIIDYKEN